MLKDDFHTCEILDRQFKKLITLSPEEFLDI